MLVTPPKNVKKTVNKKTTEFKLIKLFILLYLIEIINAEIIEVVQIKKVNVCKKYGSHFIRTKSSHKNGTERIAEAAKKLRLKKKDIIIDVQGDEPLINPKDVNIFTIFVKIYSMFR